jgi:hypothetical protein
MMSRISASRPTPMYILAPFRRAPSPNGDAGILIVTTAPKRQTATLPGYPAIRVGRTGTLLRCVECGAESDCTSERLARLPCS